MQGYLPICLEQTALQVLSKTGASALSGWTDMCDFLRAGFIVVGRSGMQEWRVEFKFLLFMLLGESLAWLDKKNSDVMRHKSSLKF